MVYRIRKIAQEMGLDEYCYRILISMISKMVYEPNSMRFNKLYNIVRSVREMSKPTFNDHLKHLIKKHYVKRRRIAKQNVVYSLDLKNPRIEAAKERAEEHSHIQKEMDKLSPLTLDKLAKLLAYISTYLHLDLVHAAVDNMVNVHKDPLDKILAFGLDHTYLDILYARLIIACKDDKAACKETLKILKKAMGQVDKEAMKLLCEHKD